MSILAIENAERIIRSHGFDCFRLVDGVTIEMPCYLVNGHPAILTEYIECRTYREVFIALGY